MSHITMIPASSPTDQADWPTLRFELEGILDRQRRSISRERARLALRSATPRDAWRRLDAIATRQQSTPPWLYALQDRIRPLLEVQG